MDELLAQERWRKSTRSNGEGGACVEFAVGDCVVGIRDSKSPNGTVLTVRPATWRLFIADIKRGKFDLR
jgi:hypothetical protein